MNLTEMEQKVREATSNDPWGASGTLKQELAQATHNLYVHAGWINIMQTCMATRHCHFGFAWLAYLFLSSLSVVMSQAHLHESIFLSLSQYFNEIMPAIFKRFAEKEPREWRQIYKVHSTAAATTCTEGHLSIRDKRY